MSGPADKVVRSAFGFSWNEARNAIERGKISIDGTLVSSPTMPIAEGTELAFDPAARRPRPDTDLPAGAIVHVDSHVVVVEKPAGISTIPFEKPGAAMAGPPEERGTLDDRVRAYLSKTQGKNRGRPNLGVVHRLDKETSGLVVFTRTWLAKQSLTSQFRVHTVHRRYVAIVHGHLGKKGDKRTFESHFVQDRGDGFRGSIEARGLRGGGQLAITHVEVLEVLEGATLLRCQLETGRTHQIRIHLSEAGHPILGERVYSKGYSGPEVPAPRIMLHAEELGFKHPGRDDEEIHFKSKWPADFDAVLAMLRR